MVAPLDAAEAETAKTCHLESTAGDVLASRLLVHVSQMEETLQSYGVDDSTVSSSADFPSMLSRKLRVMADSLETKDAAVRVKRRTRLSVDISRQVGVRISKASDDAGDRLHHVFTYDAHNQFTVIYAAPPDIRVSNDRLLNTALGRQLLERHLLGKVTVGLALGFSIFYGLAFAVHESISMKDKYVMMPNDILFLLSGICLVSLAFLISHAIRREALKHCFSMEAAAWTYSSGLATLATFLPLCDDRLVGLSTFRAVLAGLLFFVHWIVLGFLVLSLDATVILLRNKLLFTIVIACLFTGKLLLCLWSITHNGFDVNLCISSACFMTSDLQRVGLFQTVASTIGAVYSLHQSGCAFMVGAYSLKKIVDSE
eukprot:TRINITY_DN40922_c0_g1_i1.p1 TRINITY_DN40922_c0_g1~~TRINITY_DN40922_c0_g1_i1.p1  ORF type:complete len:382 (-),score=24.83 TRINITY_DN40922_c0_g1_i1:165-1277(-)